MGKLTTVEVGEELKRALGRLGAVVGDELGVKVHSLLSPSEPTAEETAEAEEGQLSATDRPTEKGSVKSKETPTLHVSLSHPLPLRRPLNTSFPGLLSRALRDCSGFRVGLAWPPKVYNNAPRHGPKRAFLALRTSAGTRELGSLLERVDELLTREHLPAYHEEPEFHTSFAWWLDDGRVPDIEKLEEHKDDVLRELRRRWNVDHVCVKVAKTVTRIPLS